MQLLIATTLCFSVCFLCAYWEKKIHERREISKITKQVIRQIRKHAKYDKPQAA